jgi:hypothetical protein
MFKVHYKEHIHAIFSNKQNSKYIQHMLQTGHAYNRPNNRSITRKKRKEGKKAKYIGMSKKKKNHEEDYVFCPVLSLGTKLGATILNLRANGRANSGNV